MEVFSTTKIALKDLKGIFLDNKGFNPLMDLTAYTDIDDERISIHLYGDMDNLDISLESVSGFSESDILELITWGKRFEELEISSSDLETKLFNFRITL